MKLRLPKKRNYQQLAGQVADLLQHHPPILQVGGVAFSVFVVGRSRSAGFTGCFGEVGFPSVLRHGEQVSKLIKVIGVKDLIEVLQHTEIADTRGDWAAANSQTRTFLESLFEHIAHKIDPAEAAARGSSENRRAWLVEREFLSMPRNEWTTDGKNYLNGLFKMLHTEGSHPGLSDEDRSTFRLHLLLITARMFLRRLKNNQ